MVRKKTNTQKKDRRSWLYKPRKCIICKKKFTYEKFYKKIVQKPRLTCGDDCAEEYRVKLLNEQRYVKDIKGGRKSHVTERVLMKLKYAFERGATDEQACIYANIAPSSLYYYQKQHPEFVEEKRGLKQMTGFKAKEKIFDGVQEDHEFALDVVQRLEFDTYGLKKEERDPEGNTIVNVVGVDFNRLSTGQLQQIHQMFRKRDPAQLPEKQEEPVLIEKGEDEKDKL